MLKLTFNAYIYNELKIVAVPTEVTFVTIWITTQGSCPKDWFLSTFWGLI